MSNLEAWKAAKIAFENTEDAYNSAHNAVIEAGAKRSLAWDALIVAARNLSPGESKQAAEYQFDLISPDEREKDAIQKKCTHRAARRPATISGESDGNRNA